MKTFNSKYAPNDIRELLKKVCIFNLCGYHSLSYHSILDSALKDKSFNMQNIIKLPSQRVIYGRLKTLLSDKKRLVIKIWGSDWDGILEELNVENDKIKVVNKNNKQNHNIFSVMSKEDFEKELKDKK